MRTQLKCLYGFLSIFISTTLLAEEQAFPTVDCVISPSKVVEISAAVPGVVETLHVDRSFSVTKGQLLVELKADVEKASVDLAQARTQMTSGLSAEQVNLKYDRIQSNRINELNEKQLASIKNVDEAKRIQQVTYWRLRQAEENLKLREYELARAQAQLEEKRIYSTINGVVAERYKNEGEYVEDQPVFRLIQLNPLHIDAVFPMEYYSRIQEGMTAKIFPEVDQERGYPVKVELVDALGDAASGTFGVRLVLDNADYKLPAGLKCFLQIDDKPLTPPDNSVAPSSEIEYEPSSFESSSQSEKEGMSIEKVSGEAVEASRVETAPAEDIPGVKAEISAEPIEKMKLTEKDQKENPISAVDEQIKPVQVALVHNKELGPYASKSEIDSVIQLLDNSDVMYQLKTQPTRIPKGFLVISSADYQQRSSILFTQFKQAGVKELGRLPETSYGGRISFGAYKGPVQANARKAKLAKLGVKAEVITRYKHIDEYWLSVEVMPQSLFESLDFGNQH